MKEITTYWDDDKKQIKEKYTVTENGINGVYKAYGPYGNLEKKATYKNGIEDGPYEEYKVGSLVLKGTRKGLKFVGPYVEYYTHRNLFKLWGTGYVKKSCHYNLEGKLDGPMNVYYEGGELAGEATFKSGVLDGPFKTYYENGHTKEKGIYQDGKKTYLEKYVNFPSFHPLNIIEVYEKENDFVSHTPSKTRTTLFGITIFEKNAEQMRKAVKKEDIEIERKLATIEEQQEKAKQIQKEDANVSPEIAALINKRKMER